MAYKFSKGKRGFGDINFEDDSDTGIDFEADTVKIETGGTERLIVTNSDITMSGDIIVDQKIIHNGDNDTYINFLDDKVVLKAGNLALVTAEKNNSAPHEVIINDGSNNVDFVVKGNGSRGGNPGMKFDASTNKLGINGVGTPDESLHVDGNIKVVGDDVRIKIDGDADSHPGLELYENGTRKWIVYNDYTNDNLTFKTNSNTRMSIEQDGNVGIGTTSPAASLHVDGSYAGKASVISSYPHAASSTDYIILATGTASPVRKVTLPAISGQQGRIIIVKDASGNAGSNGLEVDADGSETIDGSADKLINSNYGFLVLVCGASEWHVIGQ